MGQKVFTDFGAIAIISFHKLEDMMLVGQVLAGGALIATGSVLPLLLSSRGFSFSQAPADSLLSRIAKIAANCLYIIAGLTCLSFIDIGLAVLFPGVGGPIATARRMYALNASTFAMGGVCALTAEGLNWASNHISRWGVL